MIVAIVGALAVLLLYHAISGRRRISGNNGATSSSPASGSLHKRSGRPNLGSARLFPSSPSGVASLSAKECREADPKAKRSTDSEQRIFRDRVPAILEPL